MARHVMLERRPTYGTGTLDGLVQNAAYYLYPWTHAQTSILAVGRKLGRIWSISAAW
ncbi:hypothetical protein GJ744_008455 [Endocarpon pusillum]|uniref:Uncharacterized protein n=1 Tax=Endocarpon pusillum TaxID=364733 RepID=A0A8H7APZ6_9EURO|nr:hypothetical protein GJ744_008455 [Endocarpon pusillum]